MSNHPIAVLISDVHYNLNTLEVADKAVKMAVDAADHLGVRLIICGDLHDTKANLRAECVDAMQNTLAQARQAPMILIGNHDKLNEKSERHALDFLRPTCWLIDSPHYYTIKTSLVQFIPYQSDMFKFQFQKIHPEAKIVIMHQGVTGSASGEYFQDRSAISKGDLAGRRVISGHYHTRQQFDLPDGGLMDYVGNPYTLNFGEAKDPEKGYQILHSDGSLEFVPTNLRKHIVYEHQIGSPNRLSYNLEDLLWVKVSGDSDKLVNISKADIAKELDITIPFKLDLISNEVISSTETIEVNIPATDKLDKTIDSLDIDLDRKDRLKVLWKSLHENPIS